MRINKMNFLEFLEKHKRKKAISFHMPGHKGSDIFERFGYKEVFDDFIDMDITEIKGADNLFQAEGIIADLADEYKKLYESRASYLLVNGSSCGLEAAILSAVSRGGKMVVARNCHKSVYNALELGEIEPVYAFPNVLTDFGIAADISASEIERCIVENPDVEAVILPSPNYYGICSDIKSIADVCHAHGKVLIVDEAHGAHLKFFQDELEMEAGNAQSSDKFGRKQDLGHSAYGLGASVSFPGSAEAAGADAVVVSTHKTLASFTQSAVLNIMTDRIDLDALCAQLAKFESTSPSYILMASLAANAEMLKEHKKILIDEWKSNLNFFYEAARKLEGLKILESVMPNGENIELFDKSKINIDMSHYGYSGSELEEKLIEHNIYPELVSGNLVMCMTGIGNKRTDYQALLTTLYELAASASINSVCVYPAATTNAETAAAQSAARTAAPKQKSPQKLKTDKLKKARLKLQDAQGLPCVYPVIPYPPGVPIVCPGEILDNEMIRSIIEMRKNGKKVLGVDEYLEIWCYIS